MSFVRKYRSLDKAVTSADAEIATATKKADTAKWERAKTAFDACATEYTQQAFAEAVGVSRNVIGRQVRLWKAYADTTPLPSYTEAYDATVGDDRPFGAPAKGAAEAAEVDAARRVLANPRLAAEVLTPAAIAKQVADRTEVARAIARNDSARESVEEHGIQHRARQEVEDDRPARRAKLGKAFADPDLATEHLHGAARELISAIYACERFGIEDADAEAEAIRRVEKYLRAYKAEAPVSDDDRQWAESVGVRL